ncbi:hypothetical protein HZS_3235 [Henneguya salminicola]|nr:hypothetical protein HZS_3235 [Henneguya salminicola]
MANQTENLNRSNLDTTKINEKTRIRFSLDAKKQAIMAVEAGEKNAKVAARFEMVASTVSKILKDHEKSKCLSIGTSRQRVCMAKNVDICKELGNDDFLARNGWLQEFESWYKICCRAICGEESIVPFDKLDEWLTGEIHTIISQFADDDIYNADESGLFYQILPHCTLAISGNRCRGGEKLKKI